MAGRFATVCSLIQRGVVYHLIWIWRVTTRFPLRILAISLLLLVPMLISIASIRFEFDIFRLFPSEKGALRLLLDSLEWTGSGQEAVFLLEGEKQRLIPAAELFAEKLKKLKVDGTPAFAKVSWRTLDPAEAKPFAEFIAFAVSRPELFVPPAAGAEFAARLTPDGMERALRRAATELASQTGMASRDLIAADPLGLRDLILPRLKEATQTLDLDPSSPYFLSRDGRVLVIIAEPARPVQDIVFARKLVAGINQARQGSAVTISCAGAHLSAVIDEAAMKRNIIACVSSSLLVVLGLFYLTYRRFLPTLLIPMVIFYGVVSALATAGLFLTSIHIISFAFTALIIGLGTDYSIHLYDRFYTERVRGVTTEEAIRLAVVETGHGVFTAAFTTALPFLALTISDVRALSELGLLVGLGVLFSFYATLFFLPPLLIVTERRFPRDAYRPLPSFGLGALWDVTIRHGRGLTLCSFLIVALFLAVTPQLSFEGELKNLQPRQSEAMLTQDKIERHLSLSPKSLLVAVEGNDLDEVLARGTRVDAVAERYRQRGELTAWSSLGQFLNGPDQQRAVAEKLRNTYAETDPAGALRRALERNGFDPKAFGPAIAGLTRGTSTDTVKVREAVERLAASPFKGLLARHLIRNDTGWHLLSHLSYRGTAFHRDRFLAELAAVDPTARVTGVDLVSDQLSSSVKRSFGWGFLLGGVLVLILLLGHFESLAGIYASLFPVLAGTITMIGLLTLTGMKLNFMNAMVFVTILGMGSDYGLHIFHRIGIAGPEQRERFVQAGRAVLLSALTTIAGFGSLAFTDYGAMSSIGWATNYGIAATAFFSLVSLPAILALFRRRTVRGES
jgi:predicted RND superfamily exporter protein